MNFWRLELRKLFAFAAVTPFGLARRRGPSSPVWKSKTSRAFAGRRNMTLHAIDAHLLDGVAVPVPHRSMEASTAASSPRNDFARILGCTSHCLISTPSSPASTRRCAVQKSIERRARHAADDRGSVNRITREYMHGRRLLDYACRDHAAGRRRGSRRRRASSPREVDTFFDIFFARLHNDKIRWREGAGSGAGTAGTRTRLARLRIGIRLAPRGDFLAACSFL